MSDLQCPFLMDADRGIAAATDRFEQLVAPLDERQANWSPEARIWSVAACIDHLVVSSETYFTKLEPALTRARIVGQTGSQPYGRGTLVGRLLLGVLDPKRAKVKAVPAPRAFRPATGAIDFERSCAAFRAVQTRWHEILRRADGLDLGRIKLAMPVSWFLRLTAAQAILVHVYHEPRHLAQAERLTRLPDFPRAVG